jgi:hypothetical protein
MKRNFQFSPAGFAIAAGRLAVNKMGGKAFDQRAFVNDVSRAFTGSMGVLAGAVLGAMGMIKMGSEEEEKQKAYDVATALGEQYTPYVYDPLTATYVSMSTFAPAASPLVWGAAIGDALKDDEPLLDALTSALSSSVDSVFDASYLSGLGDLFDGGISMENILHTASSNVASSLTPAWMNNLANSLDPYVRDTRDKDFLVGLMKSTASRIPGLRELLPEKITVAGENVKTKGWWSMVDPLTRTNPSANEALIEVDRLYDATKDTSVLPTDALRGKERTLSVPGKLIGQKKSAKVTLDDKAREAYQKRYGEIWTSAVYDLISDSRYAHWSESERVDKIAEIMADSLNQAKKEAYDMYGPDEEEE